MPGSVADLVGPGADFGSPSDETGDTGDADSLMFEEELSEAQLRELYDDEEIDRFLRLFEAVNATTSFTTGYVLTFLSPITSSK